MSEKKPVDVERLMIEGTAIDEAIRKAIQDTLRIHKQLGQPVVGWKNGKVIWIPAEEIQLDDDSDSQAASPG